MTTSGPPTPIGGAQSVSSSYSRSNSGMLGVQGGSLPSQSSFPSLVSQRSQYSNMNVLGNIPDVSSFINQSFANGGTNSGLSVPLNGQHGGVDPGAELDPLSSVENGMNFNNSAASFVASNMGNPGSSGQDQRPQFMNLSGSQLLAEQQLEAQKFQHGQLSMQQFSVSPSTLQPPQHQLQSIRGGIGAVGKVKLEPQLLSNDQQGQQAPQLRNLGAVKLEAQRLPPMRGLAPVKSESQHSDQSLFLLHQQQQQQQQQQQILPMSRQSSQAAAQINLLQQQRLLQLQQQQQQQQQQLLKAMPQQRLQLHQQLQQQNLPLRSPAKPTYEPGMCARRLTHYMYQQQHRPHDNSIEFWRKFVAEYFAPNAKKKWCVSMYGSGRQTTGVFPQDAWYCEICNRKPGRGFEAAFEVLPRLFKIKYESGTLEELLYVDMPCEYHNSSGQIVLDYAKATQESVFEQLRVVRDGQLRIVFNTDLKICSWEFCARRHEELIPRRLLIPQVSQLGAAAQKYHTTMQTASSNLSAPDLQNNCNMFVASARQLAKALEVPLVNDLGYTKRYVRCLQISEVVNSMKDLIDYSRETGIGPMDSLTKFPRRSTSGFPTQAQRAEELQKQQQQHQQPQTSVQNTNNDHSPVQLSTSNGMAMGCVNNAINLASTPTNASTIVGLLHQNSMNSRLQNPMNNGLNSAYGGSSIPISSPQARPNTSQFQSPTPSSMNTQSQPSQNAVASSAANHLNNTNSSPHIPIPLHQPSSLSGDDQNYSQSSVQKILQKMMSNPITDPGGSLVSPGSLVNDVKNVNGILPTTGSGSLNGLANGMAIGGVLGQSAMIVNGMRSAVGNNSVMNGRMGMAALARDQSMNFQHQDLGNQLLNGLGAGNGFNNLQFDWKSSP